LTHIISWVTVILGPAQCIENNTSRCVQA